MTMTWSVEIYRDGCGAEAETREAESPLDAEWLATSDQGWMTDGHEHYCPTCRTEREIPT